MFLANIEELAGAMLLAVLTFTVGLQVVCRYALARPLSWTEELSTILFVWITMLGASIALKRHEHFAVEFLQHHVPPLGKRVLEFGVIVLILAFSIFLIYFGSRFAWNNRLVRTPALQISRAIPYAAVPVGGAFLLVRSIQQFVSAIRQPSRLQ